MEKDNYTINPLTDNKDNVISNNSSQVEENGETRYEMVEHPKHYNKYDVECIEMMRRIWGDDAVAIWCKLTAFKYRMRLGEKPGNSIKQDLNKEKYYLDYAKKLKVSSDTIGNKTLLKD